MVLPGRQLNFVESRDALIGVLARAGNRQLDLPIDVMGAGPPTLRALEPVLRQQLAAFTGQGGAAAVYVKNARTGDELSINADSAVSAQGWLKLLAVVDAMRAADQPLSSEHEGWDLALLHWDLAPWSRNLPSGGANIPADPAQTIGQICEPPPPVSRGCVFGETLKRLQNDRVRLAPFAPGPQPYPSDFLYTAVEGLYPQSLAYALTQAIDAR